MNRYGIKLILIFTAIIYLFINDNCLNAQWSTTGSSLHVRKYHSAVKLNDGRVLVAGGRETEWIYSEEYSSCELYNPQTGEWSEAPSMNIARSGHSGILLPDNKVLVMGGGPKYCELYDPDSDSWELTDSLIINPMNKMQEAVLLATGNVLLVSWQGNYNIGQIYNYNTEKITVTDTLISERFDFGMAQLDNKILVAGGSWGSSCEIYDASTNSWQLTTPMNEGRSAHTTTKLLNGNILVCGGESYRGTSLHPKASCEIFNINSLEWTYKSQMNLPRIDHQGILLKSGNVLIVGGYYDLGLPPRLETEVYNPDLDKWTKSGEIKYPRSGFSLTLLDNGSVLLTGGCDSTVCQIFSELPSGSDENQLNIIFGYNLSSNYPNPFNPSTTIDYSVPEQANVSLKVFDILGREVATLVNDEKETGYYKVEFNGSSLPSGIYIFRMDAGKFTDSRKMVLLR